MSFAERWGAVGRGLARVAAVAAAAWACGGAGDVQGPGGDALALDGVAPRVDAPASLADGPSGTPDGLPIGPGALGPYLYGTAHSPANLPLSHWVPGIQQHFGVTSVVDAAATADLQAAFATSSFSHPYVSFKPDCFAVYYGQTGDTEYTIVDDDGNVLHCQLDAGLYEGVRIPAGAHVDSDISDQHLTVVDLERNRIYSFYSGGGGPFGAIAGDRWQSEYRGCDTLHGDDAAIEAAEGERYTCASGPCRLRGMGAGIATGGPYGWGDSNGYMSPYGVIMPEDFDDTGWTGEAVGTLHHLLYCLAPSEFQYGGIWPVGDGGAGTPGRSLRNGQVLRLRPSYDVEGSGHSAPVKRIFRTLQRYGCMISDYGDWGIEFHGQANWSGLGRLRGANPWSLAGGAPPEASQLTDDGAVPTLDLPLPLAEMEAVLPYGVTE